MLEYSLLQGSRIPKFRITFQNTCLFSSAWALQCLCCCKMPKHDMNFKRKSWGKNIGGQQAINMH